MTTRLPLGYKGRQLKRDGRKTSEDMTKQYKKGFRECLDEFLISTRNIGFGSRWGFSIFATLVFTQPFLQISTHHTRPRHYHDYGSRKQRKNRVYD